MTTEPDWARWRADLVACLWDEPRELPRNPLAPVPLDAAPLVVAMQTAGVRWILNGSAVLLTAGVELTPGDLDVVPELTPENLVRLAAVLERLDAFPQPVPDWPHSLSVQEVSRWRPLPAVEANLDSRFVTDYGVLDIVPRLAGTYQQLARTATTVRLHGIEVLAADLVPILRRMQESGRDKDQQRWALAAHLLPGSA